MRVEKPPCGWLQVQLPDASTETCLRVLPVSPVDIPAFIDRAATCFTRCPQLHEEASNSIPLQTTPVNRSTNLAGAGAASPLPTSTSRALMVGVGVTAVQEREQERNRERKKGRKRGERTLRVVLLARRKHIPLWAGLHIILWPPSVISGASNCSGAVGRSTGSIQSVDNNIIAVLGIFSAKSVNAVWDCASRFRPDEAAGRRT